MRNLTERKRQGEEICKQYRSISGTDRYARAVDAIADILLAVAENENEARKILQAAEIDYRGATDAESFFSEG
jgi:predicted transcriptional regulator